MWKPKHFFIFLLFSSLSVSFAVLAQSQATEASSPEPEAAQAIAPPAAPLDLSEQAAALMVKRGLKNCKQAVTLYREALAEMPGDLNRKLNLADALNCVMRIRTNGNIPLIEGTSDTEPHKKIWEQMGPETLALAEEVYRARPNDLRSLAVYTDAYMYRSSAWGIVNAVVKGAADQYIENAENMTKKFPQYDSGLGHAFMGAFYLLAPWPLSDDEKSRARMEAAQRIGPNSKRNNYYLGVVSYREEKFQEAIGHFEKAKTAKCLSLAERDFCGFMKREIVRGLAKSKEQL
jgi:tetratricopeptide (TPR) repeat protein